jgi:hypothetical protein
MLLLTVFGLAIAISIGIFEIAARPRVALFCAICAVFAWGITFFVRRLRNGFDRSFLTAGLVTPGTLESAMYIPLQGSMAHRLKVTFELAGKHFEAVAICEIKPNQELACSVLANPPRLGRLVAIGNVVSLGEIRPR